MEKKYGLVNRCACILITLYQTLFSPDTGFLSKIGIIRSKACPLYPSCSAYTKEAIQKYGVIQGTVLGVKRLSRCHPWTEPHIDPVP